MRGTYIQQVEDLGVVNFIGLHVWTLALGGKLACRQIWYICLTVVIFGVCLRFRNVEIKYLRKIKYLHSKIHCLTLDTYVCK